MNCTQIMTDARFFIERIYKGIARMDRAKDPDMTILTLNLFMEVEKWQLTTQ